MSRDIMYFLSPSITPFIHKSVVQKLKITFFPRTVADQVMFLKISFTSCYKDTMFAETLSNLEELLLETNFKGIRCKLMVL